MNIVITWVCSFLLTLDCALAQTAPSKPKEVSGRKTWVVATSVPKDVDNPLKILVGEKLHETRLYMRSIGKPIQVDSTGIVRGVKLTKDDEGKDAYQNLFISTIPEGVHEALIILVPNPEDAEGLRFKSKVIDLSKFKKGGCLYVNLVRTKLGITIGEHKKVIPPGGMEFINPLGNKDNDILPVQFFYEIPNEKNGEWKLMTSSKMAIYKSRREICVFYYNEKIKNVDFRGIPFITPPPPKPKR